jgi:hypothetical protein
LLKIKILFCVFDEKSYCRPFIKKLELLCVCCCLYVFMFIWRSYVVCWYFVLFIWTFSKPFLLIDNKIFRFIVSFVFLLMEISFDFFWTRYLFGIAIQILFKKLYSRIKSDFFLIFGVKEYGPWERLLRYHTAGSVGWFTFDSISRKLMGMLLKLTFFWRNYLGWLDLSFARNMYSKGFQHHLRNQKLMEVL